MQKNLTPRLIPALLAIAFSGAASASGFQLMGEQSASGIGNAGAGSAAVAENASTIYYNPAGMTKLAGRNASLGLSIVNTSFTLDNQGSSTGVFTNAGNGGDAGGLGYVPNMYLSWQVAPGGGSALELVPRSASRQSTTPHGWVAGIRTASISRPSTSILRLPGAPMIGFLSVPVSVCR